MRRAFTLVELLVAVSMVLVGSASRAAVFHPLGDTPYDRGLSAAVLDAIAQPGDCIEFLADTILAEPLGRPRVEYRLADSISLKAEDWNVFNTKHSFSVTGNGILQATGSGFVFFGGIEQPRIDVWCKEVVPSDSPGQPIVDMDSGVLTFHSGRVSGVVDSFGVLVRFLPGVDRSGVAASGTHPHLVVPEPSAAVMALAALLLLGFDRALVDAHHRHGSAGCERADVGASRQRGKR